MADGGRPTVLLVGLGNIGYRHLQGLSSMAASIRLVGVDPDSAALTRASETWRGIPEAEGLFTAVSPSNLAADLGIVATSARGRESLALSTLAHGVKRLVLEKVVFDSLEPFDRFQGELLRRDAQAFVNCPRRLWPIYCRLARLRQEAGGAIHLNISGRSIGFACNAVHFLDLLQFLSGDVDVEVTSGGASAPWPSKREGYYEVWSDSQFSTAGGSTLRLTVTPDAPERTRITVEAAGNSFDVDEAAGTLTSQRGPAEAFGRAPFQSELSAVFSAPLLAGDEPNLPSLEVSAKAHQALFQIVEPAMRAANLVVNGALPIT